ncbi:MAG: hypothetical protein JWO46_2966 [Nocardioidaceae bacterium]|nr:hypothetical protein [Nocardioidaceae bacterium]
MSTTLSSSLRLGPLGAACTASGVLGVATALATVLWSPAVPDTQWSYPFPLGVQWVVSLVLAVTHLLTAAGFLGVLAARPYGASHAASVALRVAVVGLVLLSVAEILSGAIGRSDVDSSAAGVVGSVFGVASLLNALGAVVAGVVIVRAGRWQGLGAWMVLASGLVLILLVTPANLAGSETFRTIALTLWSLTFIPLGLSVARSSR